MKKIYQNPEIKIIKVQTAQIIAGSPNAPEMYGTNATGEGMSRRRGNSFWDDDEEE